MSRELEIEAAARVYVIYSSNPIYIRKRLLGYFLFEKTSRRAYKIEEHLHISDYAYKYMIEL